MQTLKFKRLLKILSSSTIVLQFNQKFTELESNILEFIDWVIGVPYMLSVTQISL